MTTNYNKVNSFTSNKSEKITSAPSEQTSSRMHDYRMHLRAITDGLVEMAKAAGRKKFSCNQLLRECYNMVDAEFHTYDEWKEQGAFANHSNMLFGICSSCYRFKLQLYR